MADEQLRMQAVVTDGFTGPLRALNNLLGQIGANPAAKNVTKDWQGVSAGINKVATDIRTGLQPALSGVGVASLGIGGAIGAAAMALKNFAFNTRELNLFSRQIGLSVDQLRQLKAVGERFGMDWNQAQGSLKTFAGNMDQLQRRWGEAYGRLRAMNMGELAEGLVSAPNMQAAIDKALDAIKGIQNPVRRREIAQLLFGSDQWATVASELTPTLRAEIRKLTAAIGPDTQKAADDFVTNWHRMQQSVDNFVVQGLGPALKPISDLIDLLNKPVGSALTEMLERLTKAGKYLSEGDWLKGFRVLDGGSGPLARRLAPLPGDEVLNKQDQADAIRRQIENADRQIETTEGRGGDARTMRSRRDDLAEQLRKLTDELKALRGGAAVQQQSFDGGGGGLGGMIHRAAFGAGGLGGGNPFSPGFWSGVYRDGVGGDPFRGGGRTWDQPGGGSRGAGPNAGARVAGPGVPRSEVPGGRPVTGAPRVNPDVSPGTGVNRPRVIDVGPERQTDPTNPIKGFANLMRGQYGRPGENLTTITTPSGRRVQVHREAAEAFSGFLKDLEGSGYSINSLGGFHLRNQANGSGRVSQHGYGNAIDINPGANPYMRSQTDMPKNVSDMAAKWGLSWGGDWSARFRDPMHFEWTGARPWLDQKGPAATPDNRPSGPSMPFGLAGDRLAEIERRRDAATARRSGDSMMGRAFGADGVAGGAPKLDASGWVSIHLSGGLEKAPARVSMEGLFKEVQVNRKPKLTAQEPHSEDI